MVADVSSEIGVFVCFEGAFGAVETFLAFPVEGAHVIFQLLSAR